MSRHRILARVLVLAVALALVGCTDRSDRTTAPTTTTTAPQVAACPLGDGCPRPKITPGTVIPSTTGVCQTSYNPRRQLTDAAKARVLAAYGLPAGTRVAEWDHLVARWAGGTSTSSNVWPQRSMADKARKDRLEQRLYLDVCRDRDVALAEAQQRMREFWRWF